MPPNHKNLFKRLLRGNILGIIDAYGAVHSVFTGETIEHHGEHFPCQTHCQWRWNHRESIHWFLASQKPSEEQYTAIQNHLTKRYGLEWWENGHHDIDHLIEKCESEYAKKDLTK